MNDTLALLSITGLAGWTVGGLTFALIGEGFERGLKRRVKMWRDRAIHQHKTATTLASALASAEAEIDRHRAACAKGARNSHKVQADKRESRQAEERAIIRATAERLRAEVAAGKVQTLRPIEDIRAEAQLARALRRLRAKTQPAAERLAA